MDISIKIQNKEENLVLHSAHKINTIKAPAFIHGFQKFKKQCLDLLWDLHRPPNLWATCLGLTLRNPSSRAIPYTISENKSVLKMLHLDELAAKFLWSPKKQRGHIRVRT